MQSCAPALHASRGSALTHNRAADPIIDAVFNLREKDSS